MGKTYYKRNVKYGIGGRYFIGDPQGWLLSTDDDFITIEENDLRAFKQANKIAIEKGRILEVPEPSVDWETRNTISDEEARKLVMQYIPLKQKLEEITSHDAALKLLAVAHELDRPNKTIKLIESKAAELEPEEDNFGLRPDDTEENRE